MVQKKDTFYLLDFAVFCRKSDIDIECKGDTYHTKKIHVKQDKKRNNDLGELGWSVLRYPADLIEKNINLCIRQVRKTINRKGGLLDIADYKKLRYFYTEQSDQYKLFD